jgi:hypothetical protein
MIAAHRIDGDPARTRRVGSFSHVALEVLLLVDRSDLTSFVVPAVRAHAVRRLGLVTLRARPDGSRLQRVMRAPLATARLGVTAFWIRHRSSSGPAP